MWINLHERLHLVYRIQCLFIQQLDQQKMPYRQKCIFKQANVRKRKILGAKYCLYIWFLVSKLHGFECKNQSLAATMWPRFCVNISSWIYFINWVQNDCQCRQMFLAWLYIWFDLTYMKSTCMHSKSSVLIKKTKVWTNSKIVFFEVLGVFNHDRH